MIISPSIPMTVAKMINLPYACLLGLQNSSPTFRGANGHGIATLIGIPTTVRHVPPTDLSAALRTCSSGRRCCAILHLNKSSGTMIAMACPVETVGQFCVLLAELPFYRRRVTIIQVSVNTCDRKLVTLPGAYKKRGPGCLQAPCLLTVVLS